MTARRKPAARKPVVANEKHNLPDEDAVPYYDANDLFTGSTDAETIGRITRGLGGAIRMEEA